MIFKLKHFLGAFLMNRLADLRFKLSPGSKIEAQLASWHRKLLDKQMMERQKAGVQEIQCHVVWGVEND